MSQSPTSPSGGGSGGGGGGGFFTGLIGHAARSLFESAMNSTANSNTGSGGAQTSRSFFDLYGCSDSVDGGSSQVMEYSGRNATTEIPSIYPIAVRAGPLILHGPRKDLEAPPSSSSYLLFNIILHATTQNGASEKMYSLFRTDTEQEATRVFTIYKEIFPTLVKASSANIDKSTLEKIIQISRKYESYQAVHIAAAVEMVEHLKSSVLREKFGDQEGKELHTPLQVACIHAKIDAVKAICEDERQLNRVYDYTDIKGNSIVHLAAECKDKAVGAAVLKVLREKLLQQSGPQRESMTRTLLELFMKLNNEGLAPLHLACINKNLAVTEHVMGIIEEGVFESSPTPSQIDAKKLRPELTSAFTNASTTTFNNLQSTYLDIKAPATGSTPLHFSADEPPILSQLLASGSDPNVTDNEGLTPLHKAVLNKNLSSTLQLLCNSAFTNFVATFDTYHNATPLHVAASVCAVDCMKALISFGADLEVRNGDGHTARHIVASLHTGSITTKNEALFVLAAAGAKRCTLDVGGCGEGCRAGGKSNGTKPENWLIKKDGTTSSSNGLPEGLVREAMRGLSIIRESLDASTHPNVLKNEGKNGPVVGGRLLSLDGGGIRGLVLTQILFYMEKEFGNIGGGAPIISYFDWVAGTSTGGILALALACGKSALEAQSLYMKLKDKVFTGDRPYSAARMEEFLRKEFGADRKMSSIQKPKVMIMTSLANRRPPDLYIFRNYISPSTLVGEPEEYSQPPDDTYVWETAKVTGAAPSYFTLDNEAFIDGGLISNNPTLDALTELAQFQAVMMGSQQNGSDRAEWKLPSMVLSIGTGIPPRQISAATNLDIGWPTGVIDAIRNVPRLTELVTLLVDQATQAEGQVVERARGWCTTIGVPYFRFSPEMSEDIDLDEKRDDVLVNLMWETWCYMVGNKDTVAEIFQQLKQWDISSSSSSNGGSR